MTSSMEGGSSAPINRDAEDIAKWLEAQASEIARAESLEDIQAILAKDQLAYSKLAPVMAKIYTALETGSNEAVDKALTYITRTGNLRFQVKKILDSMPKRTRSVSNQGIEKAVSGPGTETKETVAEIKKESQTVYKETTRISPEMFTKELENVKDIPELLRLVEEAGGVKDGSGKIWSKAEVQEKIRDAIKLGNPTPIIKLPEQIKKKVIKIYGHRIGLPLTS